MLLPPASTVHRPGIPRGEKRAQILGRFEFYEACGPLVDAETVAPAQADLVKFSNHGMAKLEIIFNFEIQT